MNKKGSAVKKLMVFFVIVAILFGVYSIFFSDKIKNMGYYVKDSVKLISYSDLKSNNIKDDKIDDLVISFNGKLSYDEIKTINNKFNLSNVLADLMTNIKGEDSQEYSVKIFENLFVNFKDTVSNEDIKNIEKEYGVKLKLNSKYSESEKLYTFEEPTNIKSSRDLISMLNKMTDENIIEYAQPSYLCSISQFGKESGNASANGTSTNGAGVSRERPWTPNDPRYNEQWNFKEIETELAWSKTKGEGVVVAVIDTGVSSEGEDLDSERVVDGYNFVDNKSDATDDHGHGTHVAGTVAQSTNNGKGVAGIAPEAKIMPLKVLNRNGFGNITDIAEAIKWSADNGADVINMSLGGGGRTQIMEDAIKYAQKKGVVVVAAAGNENQNKASFPAYYEGVVSVSSYGPDGNRAFYSNYGDGVTISAPGGSDKAGKGESGKILQETINGYQWYQGTSMASPHVAGVVALIKSAGVKESDKIIDVLYKSAKKVESDGKNEFGAGKLNAKNAVYMAKGLSPIENNSAMNRQNMFVYIVGAFIFLILFFLWRNSKKGSLGGVHDMSFVPFLIGLAVSTVGLIIPYMFAQNTFTELISSAIPQFDDIIFGVRTPLFHSALIPILFMMFFSGSKGLRSFAIAVSIGFASVLTVDALILFKDVTLIPNLSEIKIIDRIFLLFNALVSMLLAMATARKSA